MDHKEPPPPPGCWILLLGFPVLLLITRIEEPWQEILLPLLPPHLSADAVMIIYLFSLLAIMFAAWMTILKIVDLTLGTKLYPYGSRASSLQPIERAQLRRRGLLIILSVAAADQASKYVFGVGHPVVIGTLPTIAPDASFIVNSIGVLFLFFIWWRSQERLQSLALSLIVGGAAVSVLDQVMRKSAMVLQLYAFGVSPIFTLAEIAGVVGLALFVVSWFWEPRPSGQAPSLPES